MAPMAMPADAPAVRPSPLLLFPPPALPDSRDTGAVLVPVAVAVPVVSMGCETVRVAVVGVLVGAEDEELYQGTRLRSTLQRVRSPLV